MTAIVFQLRIKGSRERKLEVSNDIENNVKLSLWNYLQNHGEISQANMCPGDFCSSDILPTAIIADNIGPILTELARFAHELRSSC